MDVERCKTRLIEFQSEMRDWDIKFYPLMIDDSPKHTPDALAALKVIFDEYVYNYRLDYGRMSGPDTSSPPEYDPKDEIIQNVEDGRSKIKIYTKQKSRLQSDFRYSWGMHNEKWMIEKKEIYWDHEGKWGIYQI